MKLKESLILIAAICLLGSSTASFSGNSAATTSERLMWGSPNDGLQMSLSALEPDDSSLQLAFRNVGDHDVTLNLGSMLANGKVQLPNYISLNLADAEGKMRLFQFADKKHSGVAGRLDDYVVPLRVGSMYTLTLKLDEFWCPDTSEFEIKLLPGKNRLTAQFEGSGAKLINLDMPGMKLMNFWLGKVESNTLTLDR
jgi:hypothetical protein